MNNNIIEIQHLSKFYGNSRGIDNVTLEVGKGDIFGFIGPNGAGKSTTIRILLNLIFPTSGNARIFGMDMVRDSRKIRSRIGYVPSDANLYDRMRVHDFLRFSADFYGIRNCEARIRELTDLFDLDPKRKIPELSMGNKKKVYIIQALVHQPELLILDEPTTGLDPLIQVRFFDLLRRENIKGTTIFFSSHNLGEVQSFCRSVAIIREGRIITVEDISSLRKKQLKRVRIKFAQPLEPEIMEMEGVQLAAHDSTGNVEFLFSGDINKLIKNLSVHSIENLTIEEPRLEEIFLHYYKNESME
jgi:ABC-2 type transport system ATP-binding protein